MQRLQTLTIAQVAILTLVLSAAAATTSTGTPNILIIMADDLGIGDLGCYGNTTLKTPHLDKLASQGVRLTQNLAAFSVCTPSRAAFLTGRHPARNGMLPHSFPPVFTWTASAAGLPASELTIPKVAKKAGYRTALLGKWHQGWSVDRSDPDHHHPLNQGFDYFYGIPLTNMPDFDDLGIPWIMHVAPHFSFQLLTAFLLVFISVTCLVRVGYVSVWLAVLLVLVTGVVCGGACFALLNMKLLNSFMFRNYDLVEQPVHLPSVTRKLVAECEQWLQRCHDDHAPFLLLLSWLHVHTALATGPSFAERSQHGLYGDAVLEMDWGVGQLMDMLQRYGIARNTFVYFTSDHGGAPKHKNRLGRTVGGFNGPFSGAKTDGSTEGSFRVPGIIRWPASISAGQVIHEPVSLMDIFPTVAELLRVPDVTSGHMIDGASLLPLLTGQEMVSPHEFLFHYCQDSVHAIRYRPRTGSTVWKLMLREPNRKNKTSAKGCDAALYLDPPKLYDLTSDPTATTPLDLEQHSDTVVAMLKALREHQKSIVPVPSQFTWARLMWQPWKQPCCNFPYCSCEDDKFRGVILD